MPAFTDSERRALLAVAQAALPPGKVLPGADAGTVARCEEQLSELPPAVFQALRGVLATVEWSALATQGGRFSSLPLGRRMKALEALEALEPTRLAVRGLVSALKLAYVHDETVYRALGCRWAVEPPARLESARWRDQVLDGSQLPEGEALECDVVVVGTGAGGAPMAAALAERGLAVLLLEEGQHYTRQDFNGRPMAMMKKLYRKAGLTVAFGNHVIPVPIGMGVGGTTLINSGTCFRTPDTVLEAWRNGLGLTDFTPDALAPHFEEVERLLEVGPSSKAALGKPAELIARGCDALGYSHHPLLRNAPGCDGQGLCCFGCPTDAKRSTNVSFVPRALEKGAQLVTGVKVERVRLDGGRAVGVEGTCGGRRVTVHAKAVVLACGALLTPVLLLRQGLANGSQQVGRNLSIHPAAGATALFDEEVNGLRAVPQGYCIDEFKDEGLMFEGASAPLDMTALTHAGWGPSWMAMLEEFPRALMFGFMVKDTSRGRVRAGPGGEPLLTYWLNAQDQKRIRRGLTILARVFFAAGAREVHLPAHGNPVLKRLEDASRIEDLGLRARDVDLTAYHPLGTCRMGADRSSSVVGPTHEAWDVPGLFVSDGSVMPGSLGVNPQVTIMALALRASEYVARAAEAAAARAA